MSTQLSPTSLLKMHLYLHASGALSPIGQPPLHSVQLATHNWSQALDGGNKVKVCSIFFDIRKAFDSVPHVHLLDKLAALHWTQELLHGFTVI